MKYKSIILCVLCIIFAIWCADLKTNLESKKEANDEIVTRENSRLERLSLWDFKTELLKSDGIVIDLRTSSELEESWIISWAIQLDFYSPDFIDHLNSLDKSKKYLIYCRSGNRSGNALSTMKSLGFINVVELKWWMSWWLYAWEETVQYIK